MVAAGQVKGRGTVAGLPEATCARCTYPCSLSTRRESEVGSSMAAGGLLDGRSSQLDGRRWVARWPLARKQRWATPWTLLSAPSSHHTIPSMYTTPDPGPSATPPALAEVGGVA